MKNDFIKLLLAGGLSYVLGVLINYGFPAYYIIGILGVFVLVFILFTKPLYLLCFVFLIRPTLDKVLLNVRFNIAGVDLGLWGLFALILIIGTIFQFLIDRDSKKFFSYNIVIFYGLFCLINIASFGLSQDKVGAVKVLLRYFSVFAILILTLKVVKSNEDARKIIAAMVCSSILPVLFGFLPFTRFAGRTTSTFSHPNIYAFYLLVIFGLLFLQLYKKPLRITKTFWNLVCLSIIFTVLLDTRTRSAWLAFFSMCGCYIFFFRRNWFVPFLLALVILSQSPIVKERTSNVFNQGGSDISINKLSSFGWRLETWRALLKEGMKKPIFGYGINATSYLGRAPAEAHNDYLRFFVESGIIGLFLYFLPYIYTLIHAIRNFKLLEEDYILKRLGLFFICFIPAFFLMSASENLGRYITVHWFIWGLIGIYFSLFQQRIS